MIYIEVMAKQIQQEKSNKEEAEVAVVPKRVYFAPVEGVTVEADNELEAAAKVRQQKDAEVGDGNI